MDASRRMVGAIPVVSLGCAMISLHHQEDLNKEVEVDVIEQLLPYQSARAVGVGVLHVELAEYLIGVAL